MNTIKRFPRPKGLTLQCKDLFHNPQSSNPNQQKQNNNLKRIKEHILNHYFLNNQTLNNKPISITDLAYILNITDLEVIKYLQQRQNYLIGLNPHSSPEEEQIYNQKLCRETLGRAFKRVLQHSQTLDDQASILMTSQGGQYKAYVSQTVNQALKNCIDSDRSLMELTKLLNPQAYTPKNQSVNLFDVRKPEDNQDVLTTEKAIDLLSEKGLNNLLTSPSQKALVAHENNLIQMPEVRANYQTGYSRDSSPGPQNDAQSSTEKAVEMGAQKASDLGTQHSERRLKDYKDLDDI